MKKKIIQYFLLIMIILFIDNHLSHGESYLAPGSTFVVEITQPVRLKTKVTFIASDVSRDTLGHFSSILAQMKWIAKNQPLVDMDFKVEAHHMVYLNQKLGIQVDQMKLSPEAKGYAIRIMNPLNSDFPNEYINDETGYLDIEEFIPETDILQEITQAWSDQVLKQYGIATEVIQTKHGFDTFYDDSAYMNQLKQSGHVVFFGYDDHAREFVSKRLIKQGIHTYFYLPPVHADDLEIQNQTSYTQLFSYTFGESSETQPQVRHLGLAMNVQDIPSIKQALIDLPQPTDPNQTAQIQQKLFDQLDRIHSGKFPRFLLKKTWSFFSSADTDKIEVFLFSAKMAELTSKGNVVLWHIMHSRLATYNALFRDFMESCLKIFYEKLPFYDANNNRFMVFDETGQMIPYEKNSEQESLSMVFFDGKKNRYFLVYRYQFGERGSAYFSQIYLKHIGDQWYEFDLEMNDTDKYRIKKSPKIKIVESELESILGIYPEAIHPKNFQRFMQLNVDAEDSIHTVSLGSGVNSFIEALLMDSPMLMSGYEHDYKWFKNLYRMMNDVVVGPEEGIDLEKWNDYQEKMFQYKRKNFQQISEFEIDFIEYRQLFHRIHQLFLRAILNPKNHAVYNMLNLFRQIELSDSSSEISINHLKIAA